MSEYRTPRGARALVVAFDGGLFDTLPLRSRALCTAWRDHAGGGDVAADERLHRALAGRTFDEALDWLAAEWPEHEWHHALAADPSLHTLVGLAASRAYSAQLAQGAPLRGEVLQAVQRQAAAGARIVVRADSPRRDVEPILALASLEPVISLLRCSDDQQGARAASGGVPIEFSRRTMLGSWRVVHERLEKLAIPVTARSAIETNDETAELARTFVSQVGVS
jgi:hypothetical protein